jgi:predicted aspartyl protease
VLSDRKYLRRTLPVLLLTLGLALGAPPTGAVSAYGPNGPSETEAPENPVFATPTRLDRIGRVIAPVMINGSGPYLFIVDTGASRSAISPRLAQQLGLVPSQDAMLTVQGVTGGEAMPSVTIEHFQAGDIVIAKAQLPVLAGHVFADADGILGVEGLKDMCLLVDFQKDRLTITRSRPRHLDGTWMRVPVKLRFGRLMVAGATIGRKKVQAVIDTGAERTLGNLALMKVLGLEQAALEPGTDTHVSGTTSALEPADSIPSPVIQLGQTGIRELSVTFADLNVFRIWNLENEPALVLGMDVLGTTKALQFDYKRGELLIRI